MVIISTSAVEVSIQAVSPVSSLSFIVYFPWIVDWLKSAGSQRLGAGLAGTDADRLLDRGDEDLAVADLAGAGGLADRLDRALDQGIVDHHLDLHLGQEAHGVLSAAIDLGLAFLAAEALHFADGQALDAERRQRIADVVQLERLEDGHDHFHFGCPPTGGTPAPKLSDSNRQVPCQ